MNTQEKMKVNASNIKQDLGEFIDNINNNVAFTNNYFNLVGDIKWNDRSYAIHRANFFFRTELTVKGIASICAEAAQRSDRETLNLFAYILNEEAGNGKIALNHESLMENSHNIFGKEEFGLANLLVKNAKWSNDIIQETHTYRDHLLELLQRSYPCMLGVALALESHADTMLKKFRKAFINNRLKTSKSVYEKQVEIYFNVHIEDGTEERHAADAKRCAINNCHSFDDFNEIQHGANEMLNIQNIMWQGLCDKVQTYY